MHSRSFLLVFEQQSTRKVSAAEKFESDIQRRSDTQPYRRDCLLEIGEMVISAFIGLVGLGPASRVFTFHLLDSLLTTTTKMSICPHMTSYFNTVGACATM